MTLASPDVEVSDLSTHKLIANGANLDGSTLVASIEVEHAVNRIPYARVELYDGSAAKQDFPLSASAKLAPGVKLQIKLGYHTHDALVFSGIVTQQVIRQRGKGSILQVIAHDEAIKLTISRRSVIYKNSTDSAALTKLIEAHGLQAKVEGTKPKFDELVQYDATDWDFLVARAEANGMVVIVKDGAVSVATPDPSRGPKLGVTYGENVFDFRLEEDATSQWKAVRCASWDAKTQKRVESKVPTSGANSIGASSSADLAKVASPSAVEFQSSAALTKSSLEIWAKGLALRSALAKVRGEVSFQGSDKVEPGATLGLAGFGERFDGHAFLSAVTHSFATGRWTTRAAVGLDGQTFVEQVPVMAPAASGLTSGIRGLQNGVVKQIDKDVEGNVRVLVHVPVIGMKDGIWARLGSPYATSKAGVYFYPEVGDEVILGFINDDPSDPVILGSLYSGKKKQPPFTPDAKNSHKAIQTKAGLKIMFDEKDKVLTLETPHGNKLVLSDKGDTITLQDKHGNKLETSASGIAITSATKLTLTAKTGIAATAKAGNVDLAAQAGKLSGQGLEVDLNGKLEFKASGTAKASLQAAGETVVRGGLVRIN